MEVNKLVPKNKCCGCEACAEICVFSAINMIRDNKGFYFPEIDEDKCRSCGACSRVCPANIEKPIRHIDYEDSLSYGGYIVDKKQLHHSSSGGFATSIANYILKQDGIVFGVAFTDKTFRNIGYTSSDELPISSMQGSKYVTARKNDVYKRVKKNLNENRNVLFCGLPCEIDALYSFLGKEYDNLITVELICAGPSSYDLYDAQLEYLEKKMKSPITNFSFRYKKYGWVPYSILSMHENGSKYSKVFDETIFGVGMKYAKREACFNCKYKGTMRVADFSIGDFWNVDRKSNYYNENGTSVIFVRTKKAQSMLSKLDDFIAIKVDSSDAMKSNEQQLNYATGIPEKREAFFDTLKNKGGEVAFKMFKPNLSIEKRIKNRLPVSLYKVLRRIETVFK